ncbi:LON peptidase substrate-binding domain-containing protein [bacterium]|nr:LON peptidase substrate-binding domain-containing protein [bacterium]
MTELPRHIPLFPLPNAVLFPGVPLPLHIFEPRYREMVRDVERGEDKLIGMVLLRGEWRAAYYARPEVYPVGCAGRLVSVEPLADGRYNILLQGVREFALLDELPGGSYRRAEIAWRAPEAAGVPSGLRTRLHALVQRYLEERELTLASRLLSDPTLSDELLINFLCYALDFSPMEKQALLEAPGLADRGRRLCDVVHFALEARVPGGEPDKWYH